MVRALAIAIALGALVAGCGGERGGAPMPIQAGETAQLSVPDDALSHEALDLRALSAGQMGKLDRELERCMVQVGGDGGVPAAARFRECAFRELAHSSISQRLNAVLALALTRRLNGGRCRESLLLLAGVARIVATQAEAMLRELNSTQRWNARERTKVRALRSLARDTREHLDPRAWRRECASFNAPA